MLKESIVEICILISRYVFLFIIFMFVWSGYKAVLFERRKDIEAYTHKVFMQRGFIILLHILGFIILMLNSKDMAELQQIAKLGSVGLIFIVGCMILTFLVYKKSDPVLWNSMIFLMDIGLIILQRLEPETAQSQIIRYILGMIVMLFIPLIFKIIPRFEKFEIVYLVSGWVLLLSPFLFGKEQFGARNWINIGGFSFQPSEIVKFLFIFYLACSLRKYHSIKDIVLPSVMSGGYILVLVLQRDLGGALIYFLTFLILLYLSTSSYLFFFGGLGGASVASMIAYKLFSHVRVRVEVWLNPWKEIDTKGYQITQSLFGIGTWGWMGSGLTRGYSKHIPVVTTDFIFSAICEEFGNLFGIGIILIFLLIVLRGIMIALRCNRVFYSLLAAGATNLIAIQTFLIIGGVIKFIPLTGVTLPFISYGGSSVVASILIIGILQWIQSFYEMKEEAEG
ncbi:FtsW/RodA/SpoVE family cell cycle protein [Defluviitalea saccharophila]|uniref:FtsW/RodA/SpoVE family cell cycle protein n=1 Tax=Defluviitalea saccharophila TaxID=879970 RepID=A0ABZ2Y3Y3_9FIRM|nr:FtsW/RodA/SpoVE family cell cycle protein [Candidatus Epulonipiscium sp.]